jgi:hypothetical protein
MPERSGGLLAARFILKSVLTDVQKEVSMVAEETVVRRTYMRCSALMMP